MIFTHGIHYVIVLHVGNSFINSIHYCIIPTDKLIVINLNRLDSKS